MKKIYAIFISFIYIFNTTKTAKAEDFYNIYYLENTFNENLTFKEYVFLKNLTQEKKIKLLLDTYFCDKNINYTPKDTKIINIKLIDKNLVINFNDNIEKYGGNHYEVNLIRQILHTCFQFEDIETITFLIENKLKLLPEGTLVFMYTKNDLEILDYNQNFNLKEKVHLKTNLLTKK